MPDLRGLFGRRHRRALLALTASAAVLAAVGVTLAAAMTSGRRSTSSVRQPAASPGQHLAARPQAPAAVSRSQVRATGSAAQLTTAELAGQRIVYAYAGLTPPASLVATIRAGEAAGVILFSNNIGTPTQLRSAIHQLQQAAAASPLHAPLLVMTDQEGGLVHRLPGAPLLSERQIGLSANPLATVRAAGTGAGQNLAHAGVNVNLAPVLDVLRQPGDFIDQFGRSYGSNPRFVAQLGSAFITAQQRTGVAATAKHFPGLGAAARAQNTDLGPVTLRQSLTQLRSVDELPYTSAIAAGVQLVMTSWALYPALDHNRPAGLSSRIIAQELRGRLGYRGVIITDAITAGALARYGSVGSRALLAAQAGADLILCAAPTPSQNTPAIGLTALHALETALQRGQLSSTGARQAAARVLTLRQHP